MGASNNNYVADIKIFVLGGGGGWGLGTIYAVASGGIRSF
jgi:hypothetical protein